MNDPLSVLEAARSDPNAVALINEGRRWTFGELAARMLPVCENLTALTVPSDAFLAIMASNRVETLLAIYAMLELGTPFIPIHPRLTPPEVKTLMEDAEPVHVFRDMDMDRLLVPNARRCDLRSPPSGLATRLAMLYTSGTSGKPKGAILTRAAFVASARASAVNLGWQGNDRWLLCLPMCHVGGLSIIIRCLTGRRPIVLMPRFDADEVLAALVRDEVTLLSVVPTMLKVLLERDGHNSLSRARAILVGGAACPTDMLEEAARRGIQVLTTYGLTEACSQVTTQAPRRPPSVEPGCGRALHEVEVWITDDTGAVVSNGVPGRIHVRGPNLMTGYFRAPPLRSGFDTGDVGWIDDGGRLHVEARRADLIVTGGENVYPRQVEEVLEAFHRVESAVVFGVFDPMWGERVAAVVVVADPPSFRDDEFGEYVKKRLSSFKRPRLFAVAKELPRLSTGKPDRRTIVTEWTPKLRPLE